MPGLGQRQLDRSALVFEHLQVIQHGACLGLGIAALGTCDEEAFEDVKNVLYMDNAGGWLLQLLSKADAFV